MILSIVIFIITLLFLVVAHEFGHFLLAKKFGVKVLEFGFGIPPRIWGKKVGETLVSINWIPLGGFVRLFGENGMDKEHLERKDAFVSKPTWQRILIIVAGASINFLLAATLFWVVLFAQGFKTSLPALTDYKFFGAKQVTQSTILVGNVAKDSPAEGKISPGDRILEINGIKLQKSEELIDLTKKFTGREITLNLQNPADEIRKVSLTPRLDPPKGQGAIGISLGTVKAINLSYETLPEKLGSGLTYSYNLGVYSIVVLGKFIGQAISSQDLAPVSETVSGPIAITGVASEILKTDSPVIPYLNFVAFISLNLAILNILPFPALDGGRLLFLLIELITRKKVKAEIEQFIHTLGFAILIGLSILVAFSDIRKLFF
ncbi:hypothetical protein A2617_02040 [Candidatus Daviesbacteria bacterium RIFOXYD1_FULL_41_10]|uniref:PDZ domain-containing protein n=2 Tax=Candidatus Daviesiibacteriota TaxID=1752718 RepID=A0A1F5N0Z1_9BACT|nr:MAG: Membrane-associated zinc metalloprotease [Candidatus Daviesbacteria bacterium GW2011_GWB1_41_5]OGE71284.1 MAG: hypothetical protein A2617_02040 [Candidatus Daviesbacteria bacterium RIFOXYD1_FULL_41_10]